MKQAQDFSNLKIYDSHLKSCPLCSRNNIINLFIIDKYKPSFKVDRCADCGFIFMNPRFNDKTINKLYNNDYYSGKAEYSYYDERQAEKYSGFVWEKRIKKIRNFFMNHRLSNSADCFTAISSSIFPLRGKLERGFKYYGQEISN